MNDYLIIALGSILGMFLMICVRSVQIQIGTKYDLGFKDALYVYTRKNTGPMVIGVIVVVIGMFVLPNAIALSQSDNGEIQNKMLVKVLNWLRFVSVGLGIMAQGIGFLLVRGGDKYLKEMETKVLKEKEDNPTDPDVK